MTIIKHHQWDNGVAAFTNELYVKSGRNTMVLTALWQDYIKDEHGGDKEKAEAARESWIRQQVEAGKL